MYVPVHLFYLVSGVMLTFLAYSLAHCAHLHHLFFKFVMKISHDIVYVTGHLFQLTSLLTPILINYLKRMLWCSDYG